MTPKNDGGPAFAAIAVSSAGDVYHQPGMSMRDWFAGQALAGGVARDTLPSYDLRQIFGERTNIRRADILSADAYAIADAMIAARENNNG